MDYPQALITLLERDFTLKSATKIISEKHVVRVTRRHKPSKRSRRTEYVVTIGQPNYLTAAFIKLCKKAKEPFPIAKLQFQKMPKKRVTTKAATKKK